MEGEYKMTEFNQRIRVVTAGERPTHGFKVGQLLFDTIESQHYKLTSLNPHVWTKIVNPSNVEKDVTVEGKYGRYEANSMFPSGTGMMYDVQGIGSSFTANSIDGSGSSHNFASGNTIRNTGLQIIRPVGSFTGLTRPAFLPAYRIRVTFAARTSGDYRTYSGWITNTTGITVGDDPLVQSDGGIVVGYNSTDTNFNVWHGDGTNAITKVELTPAVAAPTTVTNYIIEMIFIGSTNVLINVYNGNSLAFLGTKTITTNLPASTKTLNWQSIAQNPSATSKNYTVYGAYMEALK
jgi:hypothetical protein